jgi:hypothetical protein
MCPVNQTSYDRRVSNRFGIRSTLYASTSVRTVGALLVTGVSFSTACLRLFASLHAAFLDGSSFSVPTFRERRFPSCHQKKFQVLIRLSKQIDPCFARVLLIESSHS